MVLSHFQYDFCMYCKDKNMDKCIELLNRLLNNNNTDDFALNWAFSHSCYRHYYDLCLYMINNYKLNYNHMDQECLFELLYENDKYRNDIMTIKILHIIGKSGTITNMEESVIGVLCKYCDMKIIMCCVKYMPFVINFDNSQYLSYAHISHSKYMNSLGVKFCDFENMIPKLLI